MPILTDQDTINAFLQESKDHLEGIEDDLLAIEEAGANIDLDLVNKVFRAVHSIKGGAGFLGLEKVKELGHSSENVMGKIRGKELVPTPAIISVLLDAVDMLSTLINRYESSNEADISTYLARLGAIISGEPVPENAPHNVMATGGVLLANQGASQALSSKLDRFHIEKDVVNEAVESGNYVFIVEYDLEKDIQSQGKSVDEIFETLRGPGEILGSSIDLTAGGLDEQIRAQGKSLFILVATIMEKDLLASFSGIDPSHIQQVAPEDIGDEERSSSLSVEVATAPSIIQPEKITGSVTPSAEPKVKEDSAPAPAPKTAGAPAASRQESSLRVNVKILDNLMTLAGELVLTRNQFMQAVSSKKIQGVDNICQRLDLVTSELQESIMSTRMQPVGNVFSKFKRIVRDLSQKLGKETNLIIKGEEVELDKTIIEAIGDPLTHLVRNSVDHGLEMPADRVAAGKSAVGNLRLTAFHEGGQVMIAIEDDGAGINTEKVKAKALSMGLYDAVALEAMGQDELAKLIFLPGMSTAKLVSDVSGRGVGMDVVHTNIAQVGGSVDIETDFGKGTLITIKLPLTLAIIPSLIVTAQGERFAIPQVNMIELVRIPASKVKDRIEKLGGALVMRLRGELLPLVRLVDALGIQEKCYEDPQAGERNLDRRLQVADRRTKDLAEQMDGEEEMESCNGERRFLAADRRKSRMSAYNILVVSAGDYHYGLIVDQLLDSEEIVVKPLGIHLRDCKCYAGATVQGDGRVALILDIVGISNLMKLKNVAKKVHEQTSRIAEKSGQRADIQSLLIVRNSPQEQMAVPLDLVSRIERNRVEDIKITGGRKTINYRGGSLPLFSVDEVVKVSAPLQERTTFYTVVFLVDGKEVGMILSEVVDVVTDDFQIDEMTHRQPGIMGSTIILGEITLLVDLFGVVACLMPDWAEAISRHLPASQSANIMVVEDSPFFAKQIIDFLKDVGYTCYPATDGVEALEILAREKTNIDLILTDIEMPQMNGLEMTKKIREDKMFADLPIIAVTSLYGEAAEKRGLEAGINEYLVKLDREKIIKTIRKCLAR